MLSPADLERARQLLCRLQDAIRDVVLAARRRSSNEQLSAVAAVTAADTIYAVDRVSEGAVLEWLAERWPRDWPVQLVMEGIPDEEPRCFPVGTPVARTAFRLILDPIDGTRGLMHDKRSGWVLAGLAPQRGPATHLGDVRVAAMTELPTTKQWRADQLSGVRGTGRVLAESVDVRAGDGARSPLPMTVRPSRAANFQHGFASLARFFPAGKALTAQIEEDLWTALHGPAEEGAGRMMIFDDQYIATGGQLYELLVGHDRMCGDLRPLVHAALGVRSALHCHPYDICTAFLLAEAGGVVEKPLGGPLDAPLDTVTSVAWMGYANVTLAARVRPTLREILRRHLGAAATVA